MSWVSDPSRRASFQAQQEQRVEQAISATEKDRAEIRKIVLESAVELTGGDAALMEASPPMLADWWLEVFDKLSLQDLVYTDRECGDRVDNAIYEYSAGDDL